MRISIILSICIISGIIAGCGGTPSKPVENIKKEIDRKTGETAKQIKRETAKAEEVIKEKVKEVETSVPESLLVKIILVNRLSLEGIIVSGNKKEITLKTEIGNVTLKKERISSIESASLPGSF